MDLSTSGLATLHTSQWQPWKSTIHLNVTWLHYICTVVLVRAQQWPEESNDYTSMKDNFQRTKHVSEFLGNLIMNQPDLGVGVVSSDKTGSVSVKDKSS